MSPTTLRPKVSDGATAARQDAKAKPETATTPPSPPPPQLLPVQLKDTALARWSTHVFAVCNAAVFAAYFPALVADPVPAMRNLLPVTAALQVGHALVCLPVAGGAQDRPESASASASASAVRKPRSGDKKNGAGKGAGKGAGPNVYVATLLSLVLTALATPALYAAAVLFGAPFATHGAHTLLLAAHVALLGLFPLLYARGVDGAAWAAAAGLRAPADGPFGGLAGCLAGAWLGAVPIPLDWDREWQRWPVTVLAGAYAGYVLGGAVGGSVLFGRRFG